MKKEKEKKRICGIVGNPLDHSLSPLMHNTAFSELKLPFKYHVFEIKENQLIPTLDTLKFKDFRGVNITHPFKQKVIEYLDFIDENARAIGSVNTIVNNSGRLTGYNTDSQGALMALKQSEIELIDGKKKILVLGAGGAARSCAVPLVKMKNEIFISNRTKSRGEDLVNVLNGLGSANYIEPDKISEIIDDIDILINATPVGMKGGSMGMPIPEDLIKSHLVVFDMVYNPKDTPLLIVAKKKGAKIIYGHEMFVSQGAAAFEIWTRKKAPLEVMKMVVLENLSQNTSEEKN
jgi:shikimate dehydrogenase